MSRRPHPPSVADGPPHGWEHLPLRSGRPEAVPDAPYWWSARVTWAGHTDTILVALRDDRLPWFELGWRPAWEGQAQRALAATPPPAPRRRGPAKADRQLDGQLDMFGGET